MAAGLPTELQLRVLDGVARLRASMGLHDSSAVTAEVVERTGARGVAVVVWGLGPQSEEDPLCRAVLALRGVVVDLVADIRRGESARVRFEVFGSAVRAAPQVAIIGDGLAVPSGDDAVVLRSDSALWLAVIDGVGHGPSAHLAATTAAAALREVIESDPDRELAGTLAELQIRVQHTRGVAATIARWGLSDRQLWVCGLGDVACAVHAPDGSRHQATPTPGLVDRRGWRTPRLEALSVPLGGTVTLATDGVTAPLEGSGLVQRSPLALARSWLESARDPRDDALVLVAR